MISAPVATALTGRAKVRVYEAIDQLVAADVLLPLTVGKRNQWWEASGLPDLIAQPASVAETLCTQRVRMRRIDKGAPVPRIALCRLPRGREHVAPPPTATREGDEVIDPCCAVSACAP